MTPKQAAKKLSVTKGYVHKLIRDGRIRATVRTDPHGVEYYWITPAALAAYKRTIKDPGNPNFGQ